MIKQYRTFDGIRREAKRRARTEGIPYTRALDAVSRELGFTNHRHAAIAYGGPSPEPAFLVTIFQFWRNRQDREAATESMQVSLSQPLEELVRPHHYKSYLGGVRIENGHELIGYGAAEDERHARQELCRYARVLQFMDATGLKPSRGYRGYPQSRWENRKPNSDHDTLWFDPVTRSHVITDEPYPGHTSLADPEVIRWKQKHGYAVVQSSWQSVYGLRTELYFVGKSGGPLDLHQLARRLEQSPPPVTEKMAVFKSFGRRRLIARA